MEWRLAEAKNKFSELFNRALAEGPQRVRRRDEEVVVMAVRDYERLTGAQPGFKNFLMGDGPDLEGLDLSRDREPMRDIEL
jgi:antitoxin Phd